MNLAVEKNREKHYLQIVKIKKAEVRVEGQVDLCMAFNLMSKNPRIDHVLRS